MFKIFTTGIELDYRVFRQQRIYDAKKIAKGRNLNQPYVFFPNALVTKYIFEKIRYLQKFYTFPSLLYVNPGTGKTESIILYHILSSLIN